MANAEIKEKRLGIRREYDDRRVRAGAEYHAKVAEIQLECSAKKTEAGRRVRAGAEYRAKVAEIQLECSSKKTEAWGEYRSKVQQARIHRRIALEQLEEKEGSREWRRRKEKGPA